ncbi:bifunctional riboflavin kinase/FAD synthetase [Microaceticoccus formicicus]|uniref:bifunctional riboflavin kinase/FAD synthetase n=1 Tax=Microaceticoccus formicicus TaxID=3118105 RepID=UPI003CD006BF|nr:bifunctional riboflavin kinase/FAD synthetase [Peptoniphilaceae bacterium AMB_02]
MKIINLNNNMPYNNPTIIGLGNFDGIHKGHLELMHEVINKSKSSDLESSVILFNTHTEVVINNKINQSQLTSLDDKIEILKEIGMDNVFIIDFSAELRNMTAEGFVCKILVDLCNAKAIVVGKDYTFGYNASGNVEKLIELSKDRYEIKIIDDYKIDGFRVSSSSIRSLIEDGNIEYANKLIGRNYRLKGKVVKGDGRGKNLGFPTANINLNFNYLVPKDGVYLSNIIVKDKSYRSLTSIGYNPTFNGSTLRVEVYIDEFDEDIYGEDIILYFVKYLRPMINFSSIEELIDQMNLDLNQLRG